jgi:N-acetylneuraminic acid mutarotase
MYVMGGIEQNEHDHFVLSRPKTVLKFAMGTQEWSEVAPMPAAKTWATVCVLGHDIYFMGGSSHEGLRSSSVFKYDTETDSWTTLTSMPEAKGFPRACALNGLIYVAGGYVSGALGSTQSASVARFDPIRNAWSTLVNNMHENTAVIITL